MSWSHLSVGHPCVDQTNPSPICAPQRRPRLKGLRQQHRICRWFQRSCKAKDADSGLFFCQCSFQPLHFLNNMSHRLISMKDHVDWTAPGRKQPGVGLFLAWSRLQSKPPNPNWYPKRQSHQSPLPGVRLQRFRIKNDHLLGESTTSKHQVLSRFIGSLRLMKRLLWSVLGCCFLSPDFSIYHDDIAFVGNHKLRHFPSDTGQMQEA